MPTDTPLIKTLQNQHHHHHHHHLSKMNKVIHDSSSGYTSTTFEGKDAQLEAVMDEIDRQGFIPEALIENETKVS